MTTATSLILIAVGAVLAFAVSFELAGISITTIGAILIVVGGIGLAISLATLAGFASWGTSRGDTIQPGTNQPATQPATNVNVAGPTNVAPPTDV